jgi:predicted O-methyltransferase YrrM
LTITELYDQRYTEASDINEHLPIFVGLCEQLDAKKVIELGVRGGVSTVAWLYGLARTGGHLWGVDVSSGFGWDGDFTFIQGSDTDPEVLAQLPESVDIVFIDTSHHYDHTIQELALYLPRVRPGGRMVLHDTEVERPDEAPDGECPFPVKRAIELFAVANGLKWSNLENNNGLGIIEVP